MSDFDPYLKWLGIREKNRPINHYRLLGLDLFESDLDVISMAADRQMTHIRTYQSGPNGDLSQQILNELARARRCLLVAANKSKYDAQLRTATRQPTSPPVTVSPRDLAPPPIAQLTPATFAEPPLANSVLPSVSPTMIPGPPEIGIKSDVNARGKTRRRERKQLVWSLFGWAAGGLAAVGVSTALIQSGALENFQNTNNDDSEFSDVVKTENQRAVAAVANPDTAANKPTSPSIKEKKLAVQLAPALGTPRNESTNSTAIIDQPDREPFKFTLSNLSAYPQANPSDFGIFGEVRRGLANRTTVPLEPSAPSRSDRFRITPDASGLLIGIEAYLDSEHRVRGLKPVFHDGFRAFSGDSIGEFENSQAGENSSLTVAQPGYAVGEIQISTLRPLRCFRLKYMKINGEILDSDSEYWGQWIGQESGQTRLVRNEKALPIVGLFGSLEKSKQLSTMSLISMDRNAPPESDVAATPRLNAPAMNVPAMNEPSEKADSVANSETIPPETVKKVAEPNLREIAAATRKLPESVKVILESNGINTVPSRIRAAERLIDIANRDYDATRKFAILSIAEDIGVFAGDARTSVLAIRSMNESFEIEFWKRVEKTLERAAANSTSATSLEFKTTMDQLIEEAKTSGQFGPAGKLLGLAVRLAQRSKNGTLVDEYEKLIKEVRFLEEKTRESDDAIKRLAKDANDERANLDQGVYLFAVKDDMNAAFEHWKKSGSEQLVAISNLESQFDDLNETQIVELADLWRGMVKKRASTPMETKCLERAYRLYSNVFRAFKGSDLEQVEEKRNEVLELLRD